MFITTVRPNVVQGYLTHWGRVTPICVSKLAIISSDNGLSPGRRHAIIWTNVGILLIRPLGTNFSEILIGIQMFSFKKMYLKISSAKWRLSITILRALLALARYREVSLVDYQVDVGHSNMCISNMQTRRLLHVIRHVFVCLFVCF